MQLLENWERWKEFLGDRIEQAEQQGFSQNLINELAYHIGDYMAKYVDPKNPQERLISDLWSVADEEEQRAIAKLIVKLARQEK